MKRPLSRSDPALRAVFELAEHLVSGGRIPDDSRELLKVALMTSIASGFEVSLFSSLGIRRWGGSSPLKQLALSRRDRALCRLRRSVDAWSTLSPSAAAKEMIASFQRYETTRWPRERSNLSGPASHPNSNWWSFLRSGVAVPGEKRLAQILATEIQDDFEFPSASISLPPKGDPNAESTDD